VIFMEKGYKTETDQGDGNRPDFAGLARRVKQPQTPLEFITPAKTFQEALAKSRLKDDNQRNLAILYYAQLKMFDMDEEIEDLILSLIATTAVGGHNLNLTAMTHVGIFFPEASGTKLDKDQRKTLADINKYNREQKAEQNEKEGQTL